MNILIVLLGIIFVIPIIPTICFIIGYFIGLINKILIGSLLIQAFNIIDIYTINLNDIPILTGAIAAICSFITMFLTINKTIISNKERI